MPNPLKLTLDSTDYLMSKDKMNAAATILERYLLYYPPHPDVLNRLGQVRLQQGRAKEAAILLRQALDFKKEQDRHALASAKPLIADRTDTYPRPPAD